jgi:hypothetical protein
MAEPEIATVMSSGLFYQADSPLPPFPVKTTALNNKFRTNLFIRDLRNTTESGYPNPKSPRSVN